MPDNYWMVTDRNITRKGPGRDRAGLTFWTARRTPLDRFGNWMRVPDQDGFRKALVACVESFPLILDPERHCDQRHLTFFIHGYNNDWADAARRYESIVKKMFRGSDSLGICVLFSWPSDGMKLGYLPDRADARACAPDLTDVLSACYDWLLVKQVEGARDPKKACRAKLSIIAHSMGNYLLQKAMQQAWTRKNQPLLVSLVNQLLMVAADVDNDLFGSGEAHDASDGDAIANLCYRVTALYTGLDSALGMSAGLKHFGKRRLGRSGLDLDRPRPDNVWDVDCTDLFRKGRRDIHSAYFEEGRTLDLMRAILSGTDRDILARRGPAPKG